ncbi:amino acid adenylation domain-containing protein [Streptomyces sp. NPDC031705]|uniref:amino acid adenylation domain-containing protein n=1 Tax=Streptomyces sp. NPDC031705 TaxID=3155729 RepID=UPI003401478A
MTRHDSTETFTDTLHRVLEERGAESATPLSVEQRRLWLLGGIAGGSWAVVTGRYRLKGVPDAARLQLRLASLVSRHEALRSVFVEVAGRPVRLVQPFAEVALRTVNPPESTDPARTEEHIRHLVEEEFSLGHGPLLRALLLSSADGGAAELVLAGHRLVLDATSLDLLVAELLGDADDDAESTAGAPDALEAALTAERERLAEPGLADAVTGWAEELARPAATEIPGYGPRPEIKGNSYASLALPLPLALASRAAEAAEAADWDAAVAAAWLVVLMRSQATGAAVCGVRTARGAESAKVVGPLDTLRLIRVDDAAEAPLSDLFAAVRGQLRAPAVDVPLAHLLEVAPPRRDLSRTPYAQSVVRAVDAREPLGGALGTGRQVGGCASGTEYDLEVTVRLLPGLVLAQIDYDVQLYSEERVRALGNQLTAVLEAILPGGSPEVTGAVVPLLDAEGARLALEAGRGERTAADPRSLVDLVEAQAAATPEAVALRQGDSQVTYAQLWADATRLADELASRGVRPGDRVAVWLRRGPSTVTALLAVLAAGAAFVPVDAAYPEERVRYLLSDSRPSMVITESSVQLLGDLGVPALLLDELSGAAANGGARRPDRVPADAAAYLIYTSGTTGRPKGVVVRHSNVVNNIAWRQANWRLTEDDRVLHNHSFCFDPSVWATFWPLATGASIVLATEEQMKDPGEMISTLRERQVTVLGGVPSLLSLLVDHREAGTCTRIRLVLSGGEPLTDTLLEAVESTWSAEVANLYGPTEATIDATGHRVPRGDRTVPVPIGRAVSNTAVHVVDAELRPVPEGVPGEIVVTGAGVALGYHDRPALTAVRFLPDPFAQASDAVGGSLYRTGDLGRRLPDGSIQFLGRVDDQVKIRGHRVELSEVESVLKAVAGIRDAAVVALDAGTENARLAAALVADGDGPSVEQVRSALADELPGYLVPDRFAVLDELPLTPNGKTDRRGVAELLARQTAAPAAGQDGPAEPRNALERSVAEAFASVLRLPDIDIHADFFDIGGTSLILAKLASLLGRKHDVEIPLHEFFRTPTVAGVSETIEVYRREGLAGVLGRKHAATLEGDGTLDPSISPEGLPEADWENPRRVFLTGATGYLGLHLVEQLLRRTDAEVVALCRARDEEHALERLKEGFALYEIDVEDQLHRVSAVTGDLAEPRLGLTQEQWDDLAATVDVIYHNGALVNFVYPYSALKAANVGGTQRVLELACTTRLKAVHHVSTIDTLLATHMPRPFLENDAPLHSAVGVPAGYTGSKWVAEKVVDEARRRGIPVTVFRPGLILGHTKNGATQTIDYLLVALRGFLPMRILPDYPRIFDVIPVDYVASAIVHISGKREALAGFYHLFNPAPVPLRTFCDWIKGYGYEFDIVPFEEGRRRALGVGPSHLLYPLVPLIKDAEAEPHRALDPKYMDEVQPALECAETLRMLAGSDIACPPTTEADAHAVMDYLVRTGFMPAPADVVHDDPAATLEAR